MEICYTYNTKNKVKEYHEFLCFNFNLLELLKFLQWNKVELS